MIRRLTKEMELRIRKQIKLLTELSAPETMRAATEEELVFLYKPDPEEIVATLLCEIDALRMEYDKIVPKLHEKRMRVKELEQVVRMGLEFYTLSEFQLIRKYGPQMNLERLKDIFAKALESE